MRYAVNVGDLTQDWILAQFLFSPIVDEYKTIVVVERGMVDGHAVLLQELEPDRAAAIVAIVRKKYGKAQFRIYESKTGNGSWKRL